MVESVDTGDLKSPGIAPCGFESRSEHHHRDADPVVRRAARRDFLIKRVSCHAWPSSL